MDTAASYLFVPGNRPDRFAKALAAGADAVILDLEDSVGAASKSAAREAVAAFAATHPQVLIRGNARPTPWFADDLTMLAAARPAGLVLPKAEAGSDIAALAAILPGMPIFPLIETALGFSRLADIAAAPAVRRLMFGSIDFRFDLGIPGEDDALLFFRSQLVLQSRLAGLASPIDGVCPAIGDRDALLAECARARRLGFGGKLCIHPSQIEPVHAGFRPSDGEIAQARRIVAAAAAASGNAVALDGGMIDEPVIRMAQHILARYDRPDPPPRTATE